MASATPATEPRGDLPADLAKAVLSRSEKLPEGSLVCKGYDFDAGLDLSAMMGALRFSGFQATHFGQAVEEIMRMVRWRAADDAEVMADEYLSPEEKEAARCTIFLGYTSNQISSGNREVIKYLVKHNMVDAIVTTGGGIEEDFMKCMQPHYLGRFDLDGDTLREKGINRIGNLLVPNDTYCSFEDWLTPILDQMIDEQTTKGIVWSPAKMIRRLGKEINNEESVYYWAYKNNIPVFCPAITDGSIGDMLYFQTYRKEGMVVDIVQDIRHINTLARNAVKSGMVIFGGGLVKHHICNANLMRNGADYAVFVNTGQEFDGSDAGARPDEAKSWGKVRAGAQPVKVYADATLIMPLLVSQTFAKFQDEAEKSRRPAPEGLNGTGEGDEEWKAAVAVGAGAAAGKAAEL